jgi:hypothetical protein
MMPFRPDQPVSGEPLGPMEGRIEHAMVAFDGLEDVQAVATPRRRNP